MRLLFILSLTFSTFELASCAEAQPKKVPAAPEITDPDYQVQGEYVGSFKEGDEDEKVAFQVIALGDGKFKIQAYEGGLPGAGWDGEKGASAEGSTVDGKTTFKNDEGTAVIENGKMTIYGKDPDTPVGSAKKIKRKSDTLGAKPPEGAVVLFDGTTAEHFKGGRLTEDGLLREGVTSHKTFGDCTVHVEFRLSFMPKARGQGRSNSGCYLQGRYEVQVLDSFGLAGKHNECGGIYSIKDPDVNMCLPPGSWQTYDIDFTAAKFDENGKKTANAKMTVKHNGVVVHKDVELPKTTTAAPVKLGAAHGPLYLQNHGNPIHYRNIWVAPK